MPLFAAVLCLLAPRVTIQMRAQPLSPPAVRAELRRLKDEELKR